ncbi:MAG TPA: pitrilysin family protein [Gammaproteobacteria bacterium]|nr:pitrilysin family protein [Gammaproteobacteria bacterium]
MARVAVWMVLILLAAPVGAGVPSAQGAEPVHAYRLSNGLKIIVKEDHRAPVVVSQVWYRVGSSYEHSGITGISHVLEHMMFKGTPEHPAGEFSRIIAENGGQENAFTSRDYTAYFQMLDKDRLAVSFELEADRMRHLLLKPEDFDKEVHVVMEERRMRIEDDPQSLTGERFNALAYLNSGYHIPIIGWMDDLSHLKAADLRHWYTRFYAPNNATVVVVGDVDPGQVLKLARRYFGPLKPSAPPSVKPRTEVPQKGMRRVDVKLPAKTPYVLMGYQVPVLSTAGKQSWEPYALEVLAGILDQGDSARLSRELVRGQQVAASAGAGYDLYARRSALLMLEGVPAHDHSVEELEQALKAQIKALRDRPVAADELSRVKAQVVADKVFNRDSQFYQAMQIGMLETVGLGWQVLDQYVPRVQAVTADQVRAVARKYLVDRHLTVAVLHPLPMAPGAQAPAGTGLGGSRHVR